MSLFLIFQWLNIVKRVEGRQLFKEIYNLALADKENKKYIIEILGISERLYYDIKKELAVWVVATDADDSGLFQPFSGKILLNHVDSTHHIAGP